MDNTNSPKQVMIRCVKSKHRYEERRDSLDSCCQPPKDWKEPTKDDINILLQDTLTEKLTKLLKKNKLYIIH